jgi:mono/diheme cytochrome c family protein
MHRTLFATGLVAVLTAWSVAGLAQNPGPRGGAAPVTFSEHIAPIVFANCATCHRPGEAAPFSLLSYEDVAKRGALIARVTESRYMPPWHGDTDFGGFVGERRLTDAQIATIAAWVKTGMPRGDEAKTPRLPQFPADGWRLGQPDLVLEMPAGFDVPATGPDVFRNFVIPTRLTEDKWVRAVEFRPSARKVVHHALFAQVAGGSLAALDGADGRPGFGGMGTVGINPAQDSAGLGGWAVGTTPRFMPEELASRLPRGSDFLLQLHFHPTGKPETEKSLIGIYFADKAPEKRLFGLMMPPLFGIGAGIDIAPGEKNFTITDSLTLPGDVRVFAADAHAHYLARQMKAMATLPDGSSRPLLWIKDWDFNWQDSYLYKEPFTLPKGTRIDVTISYDNSADNPRNPISPPRRALWGEQSFDEMGLIGFRVEPLTEADVPALTQLLGARGKMAIAAGNKNGAIPRFLARAKRERGPRQQLTVLDRSGAIVGRIGDPGLYQQAALSADGSMLAASKSDVDGNQDIWIFDVATGKGRSLGMEDSAESAPVWSADGRSIAYVSMRGNTHGIYRRAIDGSGAEEQLYVHNTGNTLFLTDWSADGRLLTFWAQETLYVMPVSGDRAPLALPGATARGGRFSPDGRFLAFSAAIAEPGRFHAYVLPIDGSSAADLAASLKNTPTQVSTTNAIGGITWRQDGRELLFLSQPPGMAVMAADIGEGSRVEAAAPRKLFAMPPGIGAPAQIGDLATADGQRFAFAVNVPPPQAAR